MILLAVTGSLYLFKDEINPRSLPTRTIVANPGTPALSPEELVDKALEGKPEAAAPALYRTRADLDLLGQGHLQGRRRPNIMSTSIPIAARCSIPCAPTGSRCG